MPPTRRQCGRAYRDTGELVPIRQKTQARSADWADAPIRRRTMVSFGETAKSLDQTAKLDTVAGAHPVGANVGDVLRGRYRLEEILARRGDTQTWRAFDVLLARLVVVHLLPADRPNHAVLAAAKRAAVAADSRILRVLDATIPSESDVLEDGWTGPYIVCEYAPGKSLADLLSAGPLTTLEAACVVREIAEALIGMHARRLNHQGLSPTTVLITDSGNVKIVGFILEDEMAPSHQRVRDPQQADVEALGRLLYAMLVSRWPDGPGHGLAAAPTDSAGRLLTPREVQASVPPSLDQICDRILSPSPRNWATRLRTARDVSAALSHVLGMADAAQDLEQRVQGPRATGADKSLVHRTSRALRATPASARQPKPPTRWRRILVPLALIAIMGSLAAVGLRLNLSPDAPSNPAPAQVQVQAAAPSEQWPVVGAKDFDPEGNGEEHPNQVTLAWDGNPGTSWTTMNYFEGDIGNKSGVGLIFDLGEVRQVSRVELDLDSNGTSLEVRIPAAETVTSAPLSGVDQWRPVGTASRTPAATSISLDQPVQTRYVLIHFTELPLAGAQFTGGIAEARFLS
jgi:putative peptidoglycan lipid II flippase